MGLDKEAKASIEQELHTIESVLFGFWSVKDWWLADMPQVLSFSQALAHVGEHGLTHVRIGVLADEPQKVRKKLGEYHTLWKMVNLNQ